MDLPTLLSDSQTESQCGCEDDVLTVDTSSSLQLACSGCKCTRDHLGLTVHDRSCVYYTGQLVYPEEMLSVEKELARLTECTCGKTGSECECKHSEYDLQQDGICTCCKYLTHQCQCDAWRKDRLLQWRTNRPITEPLPAVMEADHPLMEKFQRTLQEFLIKENEIAEQEILRLRDELQTKKSEYDRDLEDIYRKDHDTNQQRILITEYEATMKTITEERMEEERKMKEAADKYKAIQEKVNEELQNEREAMRELDALEALCRQFERWRDDTQHEFLVSQKMSDKMKQERRALMDEKRELDLVIFKLNSEVWRLEGETAQLQKQLEVKSGELETAHDRIAAYSTELEDLQLDHRRLCAMWNAVLVNIANRDKLFDSVRDDYRALQENYRTLISNLDVTKKQTNEVLSIGQDITMRKDKIQYDLNEATKHVEAAEQLRNELEEQMAQLSDAVEMSEKDQELIESENKAMRNIMKKTIQEFNRRQAEKHQLESEILTALSECVINDKAAQALADGIQRLRDLNRKQELSLIQMENSHAKLMLDIEVCKARAHGMQEQLGREEEKVAARGQALARLEEAQDETSKLLVRRQRDLDLITKKYLALTDLFGGKSQQERMVEELEGQIKVLRERTESLQQEWLRVQGHVVKLTQQYNKMIDDITLIEKQIQICEQKTMRSQAAGDRLRAEIGQVNVQLRTLRSRLQVLERARKENVDRNQASQRQHQALTFEYTANLKDAEEEILQLEEDITTLEAEKINLTRELDRVQREALSWQKKGILAVELKKSISAAKSAEGEISVMRSEIHKMTARKDQLRRVSERLAEDLAQCVRRRGMATERTRASLALERATGLTPQSHYRTKLKLAKADVARVTKDVETCQDAMRAAAQEQARLERDIAEGGALSSQLEARIHALHQQILDAHLDKQHYLEKVVRAQRLGQELGYVITKIAMRFTKTPNEIHYEFHLHRQFNERMAQVVASLVREYPYFSAKLRAALNTLDVECEPESERPAPPHELPAACECADPVPTDDPPTAPPRCECRAPCDCHQLEEPTHDT